MAQSAVQDHFKTNTRLHQALSDINQSKKGGPWIPLILLSSLFQDV